jgi:hypothetical protein
MYPEAKQGFFKHMSANPWIRVCPWGRGTSLELETCNGDGWWGDAGTRSSNVPDTLANGQVLQVANPSATANPAANPPLGPGDSTYTNSNPCYLIHQDSSDDGDPDTGGCTFKIINSGTFRGGTCSTGAGGVPLTAGTLGAPCTISSQTNSCAKGTGPCLDSVLSPTCTTGTTGGKCINSTTDGKYCSNNFDCGGGTCSVSTTTRCFSDRDCTGSKCSKGTCSTGAGGVPLAAGTLGASCSQAHSCATGTGPCLSPPDFEHCIGQGTCSDVTYNNNESGCTKADAANTWTNAGAYWTADVCEGLLGPPLSNTKATVNGEDGVPRYGSNPSRRVTVVGDHDYESFGKTYVYYPSSSWTPSGSFSAGYNDEGLTSGNASCWGGGLGAHGHSWYGLGGDVRIGPTAPMKGNGTGDWEKTGRGGGNKSGSDAHTKISCLANTVRTPNG